MEVSHLAVEALLVFGGFTAVPRLKRVRGVGREGAALVYAHHLVEHPLGKSHVDHAVGESEGVGGERTHEVGIGEHKLSDAYALQAVLDAGALDDVAHLDALRTDNLATLAVEAHLHGLLVKAGLVFQTVALAVRPRPLGAGKLERDAAHRAVCVADGTFQTLLQVVLADLV